ncbi:VOC family protein [Vitreimonas sp.]|jgi:catechol 2,3-dioxygenase-like lactoylglutathione lyase family enzyme|uniref:VOC family protein n=1 Tax=Vitreimonas sp. TaxID=3069702 RepID=UPI002ED9E1CE
MSASLGMLSLLVRDYDEAIAYYTQTLGFTLIEDTALNPTKRWVVVAPSTESGARLLLAKAGSDTQQAYIGNQTGGRVFLFLYVSDFDATYTRYRSAGVRFIETPRQEAFGKVVVFEDLYGNRWDMIERQ